MQQSHHIAQAQGRPGVGWGSEEQLTESFEKGEATPGVVGHSGSEWQPGKHLVSSLLKNTVRLETVLRTLKTVK